MDCQGRSWAYKDSAAELTLRGSCVPHQLQWVAKQPFLRCTALRADMLHTPVCYISRWNRFLSSLHKFLSPTIGFFLLFTRWWTWSRRPLFRRPQGDRGRAMRSATGRILRRVLPILSLSPTSGPYILIFMLLLIIGPYFYVITNHRQCCGSRIREKTFPDPGSEFVPSRIHYPL